MHPCETCEHQPARRQHYYGLRCRDCILHQSSCRVHAVLAFAASASYTALQSVERRSPKSLHLCADGGLRKGRRQAGPCGAARLCSEPEALCAEVPLQQPASNVRSWWM